MKAVARELLNRRVFFRYNAYEMKEALEWTLRRKYKDR